MIIQFSLQDHHEFAMSRADVGMEEESYLHLKKRVEWRYFKRRPTLEDLAVICDYLSLNKIICGSYMSFGDGT